MANYKVIQKFRDAETKEVYEENQEIEMNVKRVNKAIRNLKKYDGDFLERLDDKDADEPDNTEEG